MFEIGADVYTTDGRAGKLMRVVRDPQTERETHLIVEKGAQQDSDRLIPLEAVAEVNDRGIQLKVSAADLEHFPLYRGSHFVSEGMGVYDRDDRAVGTVQLVYVGGASDAAVERALRVREEAAPDVPPDLWERMLRQGYIEIEGRGITGPRRYVMPEQIAQVVGNRVRLFASREQLTQKPEQEKSLSFMGRINEGMPVYDRDDQLIGKVKLVYYGGASDAAIERASRLTAKAAAAATGAVGTPTNEVAPATLASDDVAPEARERMLRQGYIRIEGRDITGARRYVMPEQIASVSGYRVKLRDAREELMA